VRVSSIAEPILAAAKYADVEHFVEQDQPMVGMTALEGLWDRLFLSAIGAL